LNSSIYYSSSEVIYKSIYLFFSLIIFNASI